jgi:excisionase family DNA binding protein
MSTIATRQLLTVREAARALRLHEASVYRAIASGSLPAYRVGGEHGPLRIEDRAISEFLRPTVGEQAAPTRTEETP